MIKNFKVSSLIISGCIIYLLAYFIINQFNSNKNNNFMEKYTPPQADKIEYIHNEHGVERIDNYHWLKDTEMLNKPNPKIVEYLEQESDYSKKFFDENSELTEKIFEELKSRIKLDDETVPTKHDNYYYFSKINAEQNYYTHWRYHESSPEDRQLLLDENELAAGKKFFSLADYVVSNDHKLIAYFVDDVGNERYKLFIKNLENHDVKEITIEDLSPNLVWNHENNGFYYVIHDQAWRPYQVRYHLLGTNPKSDQIIYTENDDRFLLSIDESTDKQFLIMNSASKEAAEVRVIELADKKKQQHLLLKREVNALCDIDHGNGGFYALINDKNRNFRLLFAPNFEHNITQWQEVIPASDQIYLTDFALYKGFLAVEYRKNGLNYIKYTPVDELNWRIIEGKNESYNLHLSSAGDYNNLNLRYRYSSLNTPSQVWQLNLNDKQTTLLKEQTIPLGFDSSLYKVERVWAPTSNGIFVPVSLLYKKSMFKKDGSNKLYLYGYGSYGYGMGAGFNSNIISLVDRGYVFAIAHIRGGDELGFDWYEQAKFLNKKRTFDDFVNCAKHLIEQQYTSAKQIAIMGGSAGGMLIGNVINSHPDLFKVAVAHVPFVDIVSTMLDESLPLTTGEFLEWGNPKEKRFFDYMLSYSPYDNIKKQAYPHLLITTSLGDTRVAYWEPAKWVAKLREMKTDDNILLFDINMHAGHGGASGRFGYLQDKAKEYSFIIKNME